MITLGFINTLNPSPQVGKVWPTLRYRGSSVSSLSTSLPFSPTRFCGIRLLSSMIKQHHPATGTSSVHCRLGKYECREIKYQVVIFPIRVTCYSHRTKREREPKDRYEEPSIFAGASAPNTMSDESDILIPLQLGQATCFIGNQLMHHNFRINSSKV